MRNSTSDACAYILTVLLQRLEQSHPGLIEDIHKGVEADRAAIVNGIADYDHVEKVFENAIQIMERASQT